MERLQEFIGGFGGLIKANESVFLKINYLGTIRWTGRSTRTRKWCQVWPEP